jgi:hypothetical protein
VSGLHDFLPTTSNGASCVTEVAHATIATGGIPGTGINAIFVITNLIMNAQDQSTYNRIANQEVYLIFTFLFSNSTQSRKVAKGSIYIFTSFAWRQHITDTFAKKSSVVAVRSISQ